MRKQMTEKGRQTKPNYTQYHTIYLFQVEVKEK